MTDRMRSILEESIKIAQEDPMKSYEMARGVFDEAEKEDLVLEMGNANYCMAYACRVMSNYTKGLNYALSALDIFDKHRVTEGILKVRNIIGIIYFYFSDYKTALENFMIALDLLAIHENPLLKSSILNNVGEIHRVACDYKKAIAYYEKSLEISEKNHFVTNCSVINANIGEIYFLQNDYKNAHLFFKKAFDDSLNTNDCITQGEALRKLGRLKFVQEDFDQASEHFVAALKLFNQVSNKFYLTEALIAFSELDQKIGRNPKLHLMEALNHAIENKLALQISSIYKILVNYHESNEEFERALYYHKLYYQKEKEIEASNLSVKLELLSIELNSYKEKNKVEQHNKLSEKLLREVEVSREELQVIKAENEKLIEVSIIDELTQIYNRRGIRKLLSERLGQQRHLRDMVLMIDIDYFKTYNDNWGHVMGDRCLQAITAHLKSLDYEGYFIGRYGGEEFVCYMRVQDLLAAIEIAENIRKSVLELNISYTDHVDSECVSISIGGIVDNMEIAKISDYINEADKMLYYSKESGRNKVSVVMGTTG